MSSGPAQSTSSDMPWMIGSTLVFGPAFIWILTSANKKSDSGHNHTTNKASEHHHNSTPVAEPEPISTTDGDVESTAVVVPTEAATPDGTEEDSNVSTTEIDASIERAVVRPTA